MERAEDAGVFKLSANLALVQTVDFFTPVVDDPYDFGRIAVANALSDVYAMGGRPLTALNVVCFPRDTLDFSVLRKVLEGGLAMLHEAASGGMRDLDRLANGCLREASRKKRKLVERDLLARVVDRDRLERDA